MMENVMETVIYIFALFWGCLGITETRMEATM